MQSVRIGRNDLCPCGSGRKFKRCCQNQSAPQGTGKITAFEKARPVFGDGAGLGRYSPQPALRREEHDGQPIERIPIHYTYTEPFGEAECVYCFPAEQVFLLEDGGAIPAKWLQPGMRFRLDDGSQGTVTAVEPPRVWGPPSRIPNRDGNYARRVLGRVKHKGYEVLDVTFGGTTVTTTPNHLFYSASRGAWVPVSSMRPGELLRGETGATSPILAISSPRHGFVELYGIEVEELHTYFVGDEAGSALVHNGMGDCFKKPASPALTHEVDPATGQWRPNPWHPDAVDARIRPPYRANPAHGPTSRVPSTRGNHPNRRMRPKCTRGRFVRTWVNGTDEAQTERFIDIFMIMRVASISAAEQEVRSLCRCK